MWRRKHSRYSCDSHQLRSMGALHLLHDGVESNHSHVQHTKIALIWETTPGVPLPISGAILCYWGVQAEFLPPIHPTMALTTSHYRLPEQSASQDVSQTSRYSDGPISRGIGHDRLGCTVLPPHHDASAVRCCLLITMPRLSVTCIMSPLIYNSGQYKSWRLSVNWNVISVLESSWYVGNQFYARTVYNMSRVSSLDIKFIIYSDTLWILSPQKFNI
jgi:hypothetical protein